MNDEDRGTHDDGGRAAAARIGARLRSIRHQQGLSLADVQERSGGTWKAVVVGAYERGDRSISVSRLAGLASFYGVPIADLLPEPRQRGDDDDPPRITLDLQQLDGEDLALRAVHRFAARVQQVRGDHNGRVLSLRDGDLETIAIAVGRDPENLRAILSERGALLGVG